MPRMARIVVPGIPHHVTQRGVRSMKIFFSSQDRLEYLQLLHQQGIIHGLHYAAYVLMDNHVHLIVIPDKEDSLRKAIGEAHRCYTRNINLRFGKKGYLFQGRPFSCPMDDDYFRAALRYIERNPVRARIVVNPWEYRWSSALIHTGSRSKDPLVDHDCHAVLGIKKQDWRAFLEEDPPEMKLLQKMTRSGRPCGNERFVEQLEKYTGRILRRRRPGRRKTGT